ncbi:MAG: YecA family protein [Burkholderiales bacterium]|nr:YecA family protein [Burkholderiales bacterium]
MGAPALTDADIERLQSLLDAVPAPLEPLDAMALDGYLCGVLLQPRPVPPAQWLRHVLDVDGRTPPAGFDAAPLAALAERRADELRAAIDRRDWFDPWILPPQDERAPVSAAVLPWVAGFASALELFPGLMAMDDSRLLEPLALLYLHLDPDDLDAGDALRTEIESIEPPADLAEAVQDIVRAVMLIADVTRPRPVSVARRRVHGERRR